MFLHLLRTDLHRAFGGARFWILSVGVALMLFCNTLNDGYIQSVTFLSALAGAKFAFTTQILLILATLGYGVGFCNDWKNRNIRNILIRSSARSYAVSKMIACILSAALILWIGQLLFAGFELFWSPTVYGEGSLEYLKMGGAFDQILYEGKVFEWVVLRSFRFALEGAVFAAASLCVSAFMSNPFVVFTFPIFSYCTLDLFRQYNPSIPWYLDVYRIYEADEFAFQSVAIHMVCSVLITVMVCVIFGYLFLRGVRRKLENG